jgi:hypothetical protein
VTVTNKPSKISWDADITTVFQRVTAQHHFENGCAVTFLSSFNLAQAASSYFVEVSGIIFAFCTNGVEKSLDFVGFVTSKFKKST